VGKIGHSYASVPNRDPGIIAIAGAGPFLVNIDSTNCSPVLPSTSRPFGGNQGSVC
jgi:hypothetical protein